MPGGGREGIRDFGTDWYIIAFLEEPYTNSEVSIIGKKITVRLFRKWHILIFILYSSQYLYYYIVVRYIENRLRPSLSFSLVRQAKRATHANNHARDWRRGSTLARVCTPLIKSEEKERKLAVYIENNKDYNQTSMCDHPSKAIIYQKHQNFSSESFNLL